MVTRQKMPDVALESLAHTFSVKQLQKMTEEDILASLKLQGITTLEGLVQSTVASFTSSEPGDNFCGTEVRHFVRPSVTLENIREFEVFAREQLNAGTVIIGH